MKPAPVRFTTCLGKTVTWTPDPELPPPLGYGRWSCDGCGDRSMRCKVAKAKGHAAWCITR